MSYLRNPPKLAYSGLTFLLSQPSRFDLQEKKLLTATGGRFLANDCLYPLGLNMFMCDVKCVEESDNLLPNTKVVVCLGDKASSLYADVIGLGEHRGSPIQLPNKPLTICTYNAQDVKDIKDHEGEFNPLLNDSNQDEDDEEDDKTLKRYCKTSRKNWAFWFQKDIQKSVLALNAGGKIPADYDRTITEYEIYPDVNKVIKILSETKGRFLYFDIETDANLNITCFAFAFDLEKVYVVPLLRYDYSLAYPNNSHNLLLALSISIYSNTLVAHNGAGFDFFVLAHKYRIAIGRKVYDTMLAQNRIYPEAEKSLAHSISLPWMWELFHKDEAGHGYNNREQEEKQWHYCGKDVSTLVRLHRAQVKYAKENKGIEDSISEVNSYVRPYLVCMLQGIKYEQEKLEVIINENDKYMEQLLRMLDIAIGPDTLKEIKGSGKSAMPGSSKQCARYFHGLLNYPVQGRSTKTGEPSLGAKEMFKLVLALKNYGRYNPVIDIVMNYRQKAKESGSLQFNPWKS